MFWPFTLFKREKEVVIPVTKRQETKAETLKQLEKLLKNHSKKKTRQNIGAIFRDFVKGYYGIDYEFTYEELEKDIVHKRMKHEARQKLAVVIANLRELSYEEEGELHDHIYKLPQDFLRFLELLNHD